MTSTTRVRVVRMHVLGAGVFARVGDILDLPEAVAIERISNGSCEPAPAPPEPAPEAPVGEEGQPSGEGEGEGTDETTDDSGAGEEESEDSFDGGDEEPTDTAGGPPKRGRGKKEKAK